MRTHRFWYVGARQPRRRPHRNVVLQGTDLGGGDNTIFLDQLVVNVLSN